MTSGHMLGEVAIQMGVEFNGRRVYEGCWSVRAETTVIKIEAALGALRLRRLQVAGT